MMNVTDVFPPGQGDAFMPYTPGMKVEAGSALLFLSGATAEPLYHDHPHDFDQHQLPDDIREQTRLAMENIQRTLEAEDLTFGNVIKVTKYMTDIRESDAMHEVMGEYFGDWKPASTLLGVNNLSTPGARLELDMIAVYES